MTARFVNLAPGMRTYVAQLDLQADFGAAAAAGSRGDRKTLAYGAMRSAETATAAVLDPQLAKLQADGLLSSYEYVAGTGALILNVPEARAGAAWDALRGVGELGRIVRNREVLLDDQAATQPAPSKTRQQRTEYNVEKVNAPQVWADGITGEGIVVGVVDTGANVMHEALKSRYRGTAADGTISHDYNFFDAVGGRPAAYDDHNHGSHVAGTIAGGTADRAIGMAPGAKFISTKVFNAGGSGNTATILKGLSWMLAPTDSSGRNADPTKAPDVLSNSWGSSNGAKLDYLDAWKAFEAAGIVPVVSAGNSGPRPKTIGAPGSYAQSITVGATDERDRAAGFSSRGPSPIKDADGKPLDKPDVSAPGVDVISAGKRGNEYVEMSGTSMAAPAVSGIVALLLSGFPNLSNEQVREALVAGAKDLGDAGYDHTFGHGRVDAAATLDAAQRLFG